MLSFWLYWWNIFKLFPEGVLVRGNIISYDDLCKKERAKLQKGMNFRLKGGHSVILMSVRKNSP